MGLLSFFNLGRKKSADPTAFGATFTSILAGGDATDRNLLANNIEWVFVAVDRISRSVSGVRFKLMKYRKNGDDQEVFEHPLLDFFDNPAKGMTRKDFIYLNTGYKELTGNAFWEIDKRKVKPLIPTSVSAEVSNGVVTGYRYTEGGKERILAVGDVLHDFYVDPNKPWWGAGKLARILRWVSTSSNSNEILSMFFKNGAHFGGFIETEETSQERISMIKLGLANDHTGVSKAHKWGILPKGAKATPNSVNLGEMEMGATDDRYRDKILAAFGVPKTIVGLTTEVNRASAEASEYIYAKYTVKPAADDLVEFLNEKVVPLFDNTGSLYFAYDEFVPDNIEAKLKERELALNRQPYKTTNEVRAEDGLPPIEGGDVVYGNPFLLPLGTPAPSPDLPQDDNEEDDDLKKPKDGEEEPKKAIPPRMREGMARSKALDSVATDIVRKLEVIVENHDPDAESHKKFVSRVSAHELLLAGKVRDFNDRQKREVLAKLNQLARAVSKTDVFDMKHEVGAMIDIVFPLLKGLLIEQAVEEFRLQGFEGAFDSSEKRITTIVERASKRLAKSYNNTTAKLLANALSEGIQAGESTSQLAERVASVYEYSDATRANAVARTESFYIANEGSREAYKQSGVVKTMRWYTAEDEMVCEFCGPQHGVTVGVDDAFYPKGHTLTGADGGTLNLNYRSINTPPLHTNCRCEVKPEDIEV